MFGSDDIAIDLGTASVLCVIKGKGIVLREPAVVAVDKATRGILAVGEDAQRMLGRTPAGILAVRPLKEGVIGDYDLTEKMLRYFMRKVVGKRTLFRPRTVVCVPGGVTEFERRSMVDILLDAGARKAQLVDEPLAAAVGASLDVTQAYGTMVLDVGGGTADLAVLSLGRVIVGNTIKIAGDRFDEAITRYVRRKHNLMIGERTAEELKITIGAAMTRSDKLTMEATGRSLITGLPKTISLGSDEMVEALDEPLQEFIENVHALLERTPPELAADIFERGITMTGGASQLFGFDQYITKYLKVSCRVAEDPEGCVAIGMGRMLEDKETLGGLLSEGKRR